MGVPSIEEMDRTTKDLERKAKAGDAIAQYNLAFCYCSGSGVALNIYEALKWFKRSADAGNPPAQYMFGVQLFNGTGTA